MKDTSLKQIRAFVRSDQYTRFKKSNLSISKTIRRSIDVSDCFTHLAYSVENTINGFKFFGTATCDEFFEYINPDHFLMEVGKFNSQLDIDIALHGTNSFEVSVLAGFRTSNSALIYRRLQVNESLDSGVQVYNTEIYVGDMTRFLTFVVSYKLSDKLLKYCRSKKMTIASLMLLLIRKQFKPLGERNEQKRLRKSRR